MKNFLQKARQKLYIFWFNFKYKPWILCLTNYLSVIFVFVLLLMIVILYKLKFKIKDDIFIDSNLLLFCGAVFFGFMQFWLQRKKEIDDKRNKQELKNRLNKGAEIVSCRFSFCIAHGWHGSAFFEIPQCKENTTISLILKRDLKTTIDVYVHLKNYFPNNIKKCNIIIGDSYAMGHQHESQKVYEIEFFKKNDFKANNDYIYQYNEWYDEDGSLNASFQASMNFGWKNFWGNVSNWDKIGPNNNCLYAKLEEQTTENGNFIKNYIISPAKQIWNEPMNTHHQSGYVQPPIDRLFYNHQGVYSDIESNLKLSVWFETTILEIYKIYCKDNNLNIS